MLQVNMSVTSAAMFEKVSAAFSPTATAELNATGNDSLWSDSNVTFGSDLTREFVYNYSLYECLTHRTGYVSVDVALLLHVCLSTVAVVVGLVGNSLSIRVFSPQLNENSSSNVYMLVLAISDNFYLVAVMLREVLPHYGCLSGARVLHVVNRSELLCRTLSFATSFFSNFSTLIILAFTFDRFYAGYYSANFHQYMNSSRARTCCVVMLLLVLVLTAPYHLTLMGVQHDVMCSVHEDYELLFFKLYAAEIFLFKILPVILIIIFNVFTDQIVTRPLPSPDRSSLLSLENCRPPTVLESRAFLVGTSPGYINDLGVKSPAFRSHKRIWPSSPPDARNRPS